MPLIAVLAIAATTAGEETSPFAIVGYLPSYRAATFRPEQAALLTDVVLFSVEPKPDGSVDASRITSEFVATVDRHLAGRNVRKLLTVGGWGKSDAFARVTADPALRTRFVRNLRALCHRHGLGGIDCDWEHPKGDAEHRAYAAFLGELKDALKPQGRIVSVAVAPWQPLLPEAIAAADRIHLMAYDNGGRHSTYSLAEDSINKLLRQGVAPEKICLGIPFYGRPFEGDFGEATMYSEILKQSTPRPDENEVDGIFFNGPQLVARKVKMAQQRKLGGVMVWELGQDVADPERSLLHVIHQTVTQRGGAATKP